MKSWNPRQGYCSNSLVNRIPPILLQFGSHDRSLIYEQISQQWESTKGFSFDLTQEVVSFTFYYSLARCLFLNESSSAFLLIITPTHYWFIPSSLSHLSHHIQTRLLLTLNCYNWNCSGSSIAAISGGCTKRCDGMQIKLFGLTMRNSRFYDLHKLAIDPKNLKILHPCYSYCLLLLAFFFLYCINQD